MSDASLLQEFSCVRPAELRSAKFRSTCLRALGLAAGAALALTLAIPEAAYAQIEEIIVTTRKREEVLKDIPIAIEAVTGAELERKGITDIARLAEQSASIKFDQGSSRADTRLSIRGLSPTRGRQNAAILVDGVDISSEAVSTSGGSVLLNQRLLALDHVEIVKGPQIALYGRSAFAGAISFVTKDPPNELGGNVSADVNAEDQYTVNAEIGTPIFGDRLGVVLNGGWWDKQGFYDNSITGNSVGGENGYGLTLKTKSEFDHGITLRTRLYYEHYEAEQNAEAFLPYNRTVGEPAGAFLPNSNTVGVTQPDGTNGQIPEGPPGLRMPYPEHTPNLPNEIGDDQPATLFCLQDNIIERDPTSPILGQLFNATLQNRYALVSADPSHPTLGDGPHCQKLTQIPGGAAPNGDKLKVILGTNPFTPGQDYPGLNGDTFRFSFGADWALDKGTFTALGGYTHDTNSEVIDFSRFALSNPASQFRDDWVNLFQSNSDKDTDQYTVDIRYVSHVDGPLNITVGGTYWKENVASDSRSLTVQADASYCFYSATNLSDLQAANFTVNPACPGYTELPVQQFVGGGAFTFGDGTPYNGIGQYVRPSTIERDTNHSSIYSSLEIKPVDNVRVTLEGRYSIERLNVFGPVFYDRAATGGPGSWSVCGVPGRPCTLDHNVFPTLPDLPGLDYLRRAPLTMGASDLLGGPFWNQFSFERTYDVWKGITNRTGSALPVKDQALFNTPEELPGIGRLDPQCQNDPALLAREAAVDAEIAAAQAEGRDPIDPTFDLFNPYCRGKLSRDDTWFSPKITLDWKPNSNSLLYTSWSKSQKPGGFALFTVGASGLREDLSKFDPEKLEAWEIGGNTTVFDDQLFLSGAVYYYDYTDKQVLVQGLGPDGRAVSKIANAPGELTGFELGIQWHPEGEFLAGQWLVGASYNYTHGRYGDFVDDATSENNIASAGNCEPTTLKEHVVINDPISGVPTATDLFKAACHISFKGNSFERAPEHSFVGNLGYTVPFGETLSGVAEVTSQWKGKQYIEYTNENWLDPYWNFDLRLGVRSDSWEVIGYVDNLLDDSSVHSASNQPGLGCCFILGIAADIGGQLNQTGNPLSIGSTAEVPSARAAFLTPPRVIGLRANWKFGGGR